MDNHGRELLQDYPYNMLVFLRMKVRYLCNILFIGVKRLLTHTQNPYCQ